MHIARVQWQDREHYAAVEGNGYRLLDRSPFEGDFHTTDVVVPADSARLLPPVTPPQILCIGLNYRAHAAESGSPVPDAPVLFVKTINTIIGPEDAIVLPAMAPDEVDYEAELVIVIGKRARHVAPEEVDRVVLGYTCGNDVSARDCQLRLDKQWARGKCFDTFAPIGPWIAVDVDPSDLEIRLRLNGREMQCSTTADMIFDCRRLVSYLSDCMTLLPGSVIFTGTPQGVGFARKPPVFLRPGDVVEVEIERIGVLRNPVIAERG